MWRRLAFTNLIIAFFASNIVAFVRLGTPYGGATRHDFLRLCASPDEIIVKFKTAAAAALEEKTSVGPDAVKTELPGSLDKLNKKFRLRNIRPLFKNFKAHRNEIKALLKKDKTSLNKQEKRILQRLKRAPEKVPHLLSESEFKFQSRCGIPELDRIYTLQFALAPDESIQDILAAYNNDPNVEYAELNYRVSIHKGVPRTPNFAFGGSREPDDPLYPLQWPLDNTGQDYPASGKYNLPPGTPDSDIDAPQAWDIHTGSSDVIVAVVDTGVDYTHRDIADNIWVNQTEWSGMAGTDDDGNGYIDDIYGYDFVNHDNNPYDDNGHGTHCAGTIAARGNNGLDIAGVCWNAKIMALKFLDENGEGFTSDAATAIYYATKMGADVISNSWGGPYESEALKEAMDYAHSQGVIIVAAAGNNNSDSPDYPAYYENMIAVAATNSNDRKAPFSNYGGWVDIAAPGVDILSLRAAGTSLGTVYDNYTTIASGTSMACPHIAAVIALIISNHPDACTDVIVARLFATTDDISTQNPGFDGLLGAGRVNAYKAVRDGFEGIVTFDPDKSGYSCDDTIRIEVFDFDLIPEPTQPITITTDGGDCETVILNSDPGTPWLFSGTIPTSSDAVITEDGTLQVSHGLIITAIYLDGDDGSGNPAAATVTATADCEGPQIFNVKVDAQGPEPTVTFQTNEKASARLLASLACGEPYIIEANSLNLAESHSIKLTGVSPKTDYFFIIEAVDVVENKTVDDNAGSCFSFTTDEGPGDIYVPADYPTIQEAIKYSWNSGTVWVADGNYIGQGNRDIDFLGREIIVRSENGPAHCIIDPQGSELEPHRGFYFHRGEGRASILYGFTIINGYVNDEGGGIYCNGSSPILINCILRDNAAQYWGGAICNRHSSSQLSNCVFSENSAYWGSAVACCYCEQGPTLVNCTFSNNSASHSGAMYNDHSRPTVINSNFSGNSARYGAGVYNFSGVFDSSFHYPKLYNCTFSGNSASSYGGGMFNFESSPAVTNCEFTSNSALHYAGAIYNSEKSDPVVADCTFSGNSAAYGGAIYSSVSSRPELTNCTITGNSAQKNGGAMFGGLGPVSNCTISDNNSVYAGGGLYGCNGPITNCIIRGNTAGSFGGALYSCQGQIISCTIADNSAGALDHCSGPIINCILWNNSPPDLVLLACSIPLYSCVQGGSDGIGCISLNPCFIDAQNGDYHLSFDSPCKDAGSYYYCMNLPCTDRDGMARMVDGQLDMGCYEAGGMPDVDGDWLTASQERIYGTHPNLPDTDGDGLVDGLEILNGTNPLTADPPRIWRVCPDSGVPQTQKVAFGQPSRTIQQALFFSRPGETIVLGEGTYYENIYLGGRNINITGTEPNAPDVVAATIINGDTDRNSDTMSGRVISFAGTEGITCHIRGLTITRGCTNARGGGIYGAGTNAEISNCIISSNIALDGGGGLYGCDGVIKNCAVTGNSAKDGGGLYYCDGPVINCNITANIADYNGGGMFDCGGGSQPQFFAAGVPGEYVCDAPYDCVFTITNCIISDNSANSGGGMYNNVISPILTKCTFSRNTAKNFGGGIYNNERTKPILTNCMFIDNSADSGGAMFSYKRTSLTLTNCTYAGNSATNGNCLACDSPGRLYPSYFQLANCILWDSGEQIFNNDNSDITITYSDIRGGWTGEGNIDTEPLFVDADKGDYRLSAGSPCIDAGTDTGVNEDIDGNIRPFDFPDVDHNGKLPDFDMGAYEAVIRTEVNVWIVPRTINRRSRLPKILAVVRLPEGVGKDEIELDKPLMLYPGCIKATPQYVVQSGRRGSQTTIIFAFFDKTKLMEAVTDNGRVQLRVFGIFETGQYFYGTDKITLISPRQR